MGWGEVGCLCVGLCFWMLGLCREVERGWNDGGRGSHGSRDLHHHVSSSVALIGLIELE